MAVSTDCITNLNGFADITVLLLCLLPQWTFNLVSRGFEISPAALTVSLQVLVQYAGLKIPPAEVQILQMLVQSAA